MRLPARALSLAVVLLAPTIAHAQTPEAKAEALFHEGKAEAKKGNVAVACEKFALSHKLDPAGGTILHVADCHENDGRLASAWSEYNEALAYALRDKRQDRETVARERIAALEPRLGHVVLSISTETLGTSGLEIALDGRRLDAGSAARIIPADRGRHAITATAPGKQGWRGDVMVVDGVPSLVEVPALLPADSKTELTWVQRHPRRTAALVVGGLGVIGVGIGTVFGLRAVSIGDQSARCTLGPGGTGCPDAAVADQDSARTAADVSTIAFIAGTVAIGGAVALWITAPETSKNVALGVAPLRDGAGISLRGAL